MIDYQSFEHVMKNKWNWIIGLLWGFCEGVFFFVVPDVYVGFAMLLSFWGGVKAFIASLIGSFIAIVFVFFLAPSFGDSFFQFLALIPGISDEMITGAGFHLAEQGLSGLIRTPFSDTPYKVYLAHAAVQGFSLSALFLWITFVRMLRMVPIALFFGAVGAFFRSSITKYFRYWVFGYCFFWVIIYIFYFVK